MVDRWWYVLVMPDDATDYSTDPAFLDAVEKAVSAREAEAQRKRDRSKPFKDPGDAIDRIADAVWDRFEERRAAGQKHDEPDEPPATGGKSGGVLGFLGGGE